MTRTTVEPNWTPRQREVLDLLVKGYTNSEIAQRLGISLDGAKWHVSEIITRLGVDSRDEAAEYWRHYNGLRMRFTRIASGFFSSGALKWGMATAFIAGVVVVSAMVVVALRETGGDENNQGGGNQAEGTQTPTTSPTAPTTSQTPAPSVTPLPTGETIAGVPVSHVKFTQPGGLPVDGLSLIIEKGCYQCDGPASAIERVTSVNGQHVVETLFTSADTQAPEDYIASSLFDSGTGAYYIAVCSRGYCGGVGQVSPDAQTTILRSTDGGVTWENLETFDGPGTIATVTQQGPLLNVSTFQNGVIDYKFRVVGSTDIVRPPAGYEPAYSQDRALGWRETNGFKVVNFDGSDLVTLPDVGLPQNQLGRLQVASVLSGGGALVSWLSGPSPAEQYRYLGIVQGGKLTKIFRSDASLIVGDWANQGLLVGNIVASPTDVEASNSNNQGKLHPMMMDLNTGEIQLLELYGPAFSDAYAFERNRVRAYEAGPFLRVTGAGDCLNVREQPSTTAPVVQCFADNVLLKDLNQEQPAGGITWLKVQTPTGKEGWASAEFLKD